MFGEAVELEETAPPRERRSPMSHHVARRVQFGTAVVHSTYESPFHCGLVGRSPATLQRRVPIKF